jgi:hypothetical protein
MKKKLEDYLHLYLGCEVEFVFETRTGGKENRTGRIERIGKNGVVKDVDIFGANGAYIKRADEVKPILRPLSDMTEEEAIELTKLTAWKYYGGHPSERVYKTYKNAFGQLVVSWGEHHREKNVPITKSSFYPEEIPWLLSKGFDLFNLIHEGLAIDKSTTTTPK